MKIILNEIPIATSYEGLLTHKIQNWKVNNVYEEVGADMLKGFLEIYLYYDGSIPLEMEFFAKCIFPKQ